MKIRNLSWEWNAIKTQSKRTKEYMIEIETHGEKCVIETSWQIDCLPQWRRQRHNVCSFLFSYLHRTIGSSRFDIEFDFSTFLISSRAISCETTGKKATAKRNENQRTHEYKMLFFGTFFSSTVFSLHLLYITKKIEKMLIAGDKKTAKCAKSHSQFHEIFMFVDFVQWNAADNFFFWHVNLNCLQVLLHFVLQFFDFHFVCLLSRQYDWTM